MREIVWTKYNRKHKKTILKYMNNHVNKGIIK